MHVADDPQIGTRFRELEQHFAHWEKIKDCIDQNIDVFENYRQSGHPGGSRSKVHMLVALTLGGFMRWDIRRPEHGFRDGFSLVAGQPHLLLYLLVPAYKAPLQAAYAPHDGAEPPLIVDESHQLVQRDLVGCRRT